jgi:hypothetical protein
MRAVFLVPCIPSVRLTPVHLYLRFLLLKQPRRPLQPLYQQSVPSQMARTLSFRVLTLQVLGIATSVLMAAALLSITILTIPLNSPIKSHNYGKQVVSPLTRVSNYSNSNHILARIQACRKGGSLDSALDCNQRSSTRARLYRPSGTVCNAASV